MTHEADSAEAFLKAAPTAVGNSGAPALRLGAYEGPLDLLLELARAQRVDLAQISVAGRPGRAVRGGGRGGDRAAGGAAAAVGGLADHGSVADAAALAADVADRGGGKR
ncbi:hypothetical protein [Belnapia moabensis]|uniref:hypothetical protein n=1 Tax=Belnapia moabensis TaxID=365533 RepID=UPI000694EC85|nr:hypothetical protein [Belnapia moabensis]